MEEKLKQMMQILESTLTSDEEKEDDKDTEVNLEKDLKDQGDDTSDKGNAHIISVINGMIEGKNTIEDLEKAIKSKK